jgi:hypothetical protein
MFGTAGALKSVFSAENLYRPLAHTNRSTRKDKCSRQFPWQLRTLMIYLRQILSNKRESWSDPYGSLQSD